MNIKFLTFIRKLKRKITLFLFNLRRRDNLRIGIFRGTPYEMGFSHGKIFKKQIKYTYNKHNKFYKFKNLNKHKISKLVNFIENKFPEFIEEMKGIADGSDMNKEDIIFLNLFPVINSIISRSKCTSVGFISNDKGPILGQNVDLGLEWRYYFIKKISPKNGYRSISGSWFGTIWQTVGMNEYGLCIGGSSVNVKKSHYDEIEDIILSNTVPLHFLSSLILSQCKNVEEAISLLNKYRFTLPFVVGESALLLDIEGKLAVIEKGGGQQTIKKAPLLYTTNIYIDSKMEKIMDIDSSESIKEITINAKERYRTLNNLFRDIPKQRYSLDLMKTILSNHNPKGAICRHYGIGNEIGNTTFSYIMVSQQRKFLVADGYPCCTKFKEIFLK